MIRYGSIYIGILTCLMISSCTPEQSDFIIESDYLLVKTQAIPSGQNPLLTYFWIENNVKSTIEGDLATRNLTFQDISQINTAQAILQVRNLDGDLSALSEVILRIADSSNPDIKLEAAYTIRIDDRFQNELELIPSLTNLKDVLMGDRFNVELQMRFREVNITPLAVELYLKLGIVE